MMDNEPQTFYPFYSQIRHNLRIFFLEMEIYVVVKIIKTCPINKLEKKGYYYKLRSSQ